MRPEEEVICLFNNASEEKVIDVSRHGSSRIPEGAELNDLLSERRIRVIKDSYFQWKEAGPDLEA